MENSLQDDEETHEALPPTDENGNGIAHRTTSSETKGGKDTEEETQFPSGSLFNYRIPGVLSKEQVAAECDLDHWKMLVQGTLVDIQVGSRSSFGRVCPSYLTRATRILSAGKIWTSRIHSRSRALSASLQQPWDRAWSSSLPLTCSGLRNED